MEPGLCVIIIKISAVLLDITKRPEAIDSGNLIIDLFDEKNILDSINISVNAKSKVEPLDYSNLDFSEKVVKIIQSYTPIVNKEVKIKTKVLVLGSSGMLWSCLDNYFKTR